MRKQLAVISLGLVGLLSLASCAKEVSVSDAKAQANKYDANAVSEKYSGGTVISKAKINKATGIFELMTGQYKDSTGTITVSSEFITSAMIDSSTKDESAALSTDPAATVSTKFYLNGSALSIKQSLSYTTTANGLTVSVSEDFAMSGNNEGLIVSTYAHLIANAGNTNAMDVELTANVTWTTK
jgi:hypothetical protein